MKLSLSSKKHSYTEQNAKKPVPVCPQERTRETIQSISVYLLTSASTFSSAMEFAELIKNNDLGTIIGEAPGNYPNGYGEAVVFQLPNSKLNFQVSTKEFSRADTETDDKWVSTDAPCDSENALDVLYAAIF